MSIVFFVWLFLKPSALAALLATGTVALLILITFFIAKDGMILLRRFLPVLFVVAILFPYLRLPGGIPDIRPEFIIILAASGLILLDHLATGHPLRIRRYPVYKWFALFAFAIMLSMMYASSFKGQPVAGRDFWEIAKPLLYFLIFVLVASDRINPAKLKRYYKFILLILAFSAVVGFLQYLNFAGINRIVSPYYAPTQIQGLLVHRRITGTTPNPNEFGALMVLASSLALSGTLFFREYRMRRLCWAVFPFYIFSLVLTVSRTSIISLFVSFATIMFLFFKKRGLRRSFVRLFIVILLGFIIGLLILQFTPAKALSRFGELTTFTSATSWQARIHNWETHYTIWLKSPWLGWGPGKADMGTVVDNEWLLLLRRYGVVGLAAFLSLFGSIYTGLSRIRKNNREPSAVALSIALQGTFVGYVVYMALAVVYHSLQLMPILLLFLGLAYTQHPPARTDSRSL